METTPKIQKSLSVLCTPGDDLDAVVSPLRSHERRTMSSSLRQKLTLKRSRRSFTSPLSVAKRLNVDEVDGSLGSPATNDTAEMVTTQKEVDLNHNENISCEQSSKQTPGTHANSTSHSAQTDSLQLRDGLRREVKEKTETLRRLQMVRMYRKKNDLSELRTLISKWRHCAQGALYELQTALPIDGRKASLGQLMDHFGLEDRLLHYDRTEDDFRQV